MATSTITPIDIEKYLLQDYVPEEPEAKKRLPAKPPLDAALTDYYNKTAPPGSRQLAPGETPLAVSTEIEGPPTPGILSRLPSLPSFGGGAVPAAADRSIAGAASPLATTPIAPSAPIAPITTTEPLAAGKVPGATAATPTQLDKPSAWYDTLQKHAGFVRDVAEGGGALIAGVGAFGYGALTAGSEVLNDWLARVAKEGPMAGGPESPTYYRDVFKRMDKRIADISYEPKSDIAKNMVKGVGKALGLVKDVADLAGTASTYVGFNEDQAKVLSFAAEMYLLYKLDSGVRNAAPELRSKIADYRAKATRGSDAEMAAAAENLADAASRNPNLDGAMNEARGKFRDEGEAAAARGPVGPRPGPPTPEGMYYDPADIAAYTRTVQEFSAQFRRDNPNASIRDVRDALETLPKPEPKPVPEAPQRPAPAPEAPAPEPTRVTPSGDIILSEDLRSYVADQVAAGIPVDQIVHNVRPSVRGDISDSQIREAVRTQTTPGAAAPPLRPEDIPPGEMVVRPRVEPAAAVTPPEVSPSSSGDLSVAAAVPPEARAIAAPPTPETPVSAAATVAPETVPAPVSPEPVAATPEVAAVTPSDAAPQASQVGAPVAAATRARELYESANAMGVTDKQYRERLAELKGIVREGLRPNQSARANLEKLGFTPEEIPLIDKQLKGVRATKPTPAVQTATAEAVLESAPPGTEVEIPPPTAEAVVDTSPAIAKPKRKRRVVKAPSAAEMERARVGKEIEAESDASLQRHIESQYEEMRYVVERQLRGTDISLEDASRMLKDAFDRGMMPTEAWEVLGPSVPPEAALRAASHAYNLYVHGSPIERPPINLSAGNKAKFVEVTALTELDQTARASLLPSGYNEPGPTPIQVRTKGGAPDALFIDTKGMNSRTSLADIQRQVESGRMPILTAAALRVGLERQAIMAGVPIERAHNFTSQELMREVTRIAAKTGLDLYVKKGTNYELVPKDVVRTDARLNRGDNLAATPISADAAGAYVESKTSDIGPDAVRDILEAVELGIDISSELPAELLPHYRAMIEQQRAGIDTSERRSDIDIAVDVEIIKEELRTPPGERVKGPRLRGVGRRGPLSNEGGFIDLDLISDAARMAAQRLQADMRKLGKGVREFLFGARPEDVAMFENYLKRINNPAPPDSTNPRNMRFDPTTKSRTDRVVKHRVVSAALHLEAPPLWQSEVAAIQAANDIKPGGSIVSVKTPYWQHVKANTQFIYHSYRTAQKNVDASIADLQTDMHELGRGFSTKSLENIGANGYLRQGPDGQRILTYNKVKPTPLSPAEKRLQANLDVIYDDFWVRINEERVATGREPLPPIDNYQTFARTQSLLNHLNMGSNLITDSAADIMAKYAQHKSTNFPYTIARKGAVYSAEMNALKILDTYAQSALKEIFLGPFLGKLHELIETKLPDPVTGKETWLLKDEKPGLYQELSRWKDYLATGSNLEVPEVARYWLGIANRNLGYAMLSFALRSGAVQLSTIRNTHQSLGTVATTKGVVNHLMDIVSGGKKFDFALKESEVLASRKFIDAYSDTAAAIVGRRPGDFLRAIARGQVGEIQAAIGGVGMKILEIPDMQAAVMSWNAAYDHFTSKKVGYSHKDAKRAADDLVVRSQGSTMPGDLAGIQRNAIGKAITQFQTFAVSDWNFLTNEVFSKQQGKVSNLKMVGNIIKYAVATQLMNEFYRMLHIQPPGIEFIRDWSKKGSSTAANIGRGLSNFLEPIPLLRSTRHGRSVAGPLVETGRDFTRALREDPMAPSPFEPGAMLLGVPGARAMSKYIRAKKRGESEIDSLLGWYSEDSGARRRRPERRARPSR